MAAEPTTPPPRRDGAEQLAGYIDADQTGPLRAVADAFLTALPPSAERTAGMRKLVEAHDCFVRAMRDVDRVDGR